MKNNIIKSEDYKIWLKNLKLKVRQVQLKAATTVNAVLLKFYWDLGNDIIEKQKKAAWGSGFLKQLSKDLMNEFPDMKGFSVANLSFMRRWVLFYCNYTKGNFVTGCYEIDKITKPQQILGFLDNKKGQQLVDQLFFIPWSHNIIIISKCKDIKQALFYVNKTIENGWSRTVLTHQIESGLFERSGNAISNFSNVLPKPQSDLANELIKDPFNFDFLTLTKNYNERELEKSLINNISKFLLELGAGFAFVGKQKALNVGERTFYIDLLFYHIQMHCFIVVELKTVDFEPEFAGKLNFYIKAVDEQIKTEKDGPTIGILICKSKDKTVVEYALSDIYKPMAVSEYNLTHVLPDNLKSSLPTIEEIQAEFDKNTTDETKL